MVRAVPLIEQQRSLFAGERPSQPLSVSAAFVNGAHPAGGHHLPLVALEPFDVHDEPADASDNHERVVAREQTVRQMVRHQPDFFRQATVVDH